MNDIERLAANLRRLMKISGLETQAKLGNAAGLSQTNMSNIMRGTVQPQLDTLTALAKALKVETWQLLVPEAPMRLLHFYSIAGPKDRDTLLEIAESLSRNHPAAN